MPKRPTGVEVRQYHNDGRLHSFLNWVNGGGEGTYLINGTCWTKESLIMHTPGGDLKVCDGDWVIREVHGGFCVWKPDVFEKTYEAVA